MLQDIQTPPGLTDAERIRSLEGAVRVLESRNADADKRFDALHAHLLRVEGRLFGLVASAAGAGAIAGTGITTLLGGM